jgi:hypothetical protein
MTTTTDKRLNKAIALVQSRGLTVISPKLLPWMTPSELFARYLHGSTKSRMHRRLGGSSAPPFDVTLGERGRLIALRPTRELIAYLSKPNQGGRRL